ncbi:regulator of nonsense transcripts 1 homolog [Paramacrobiotus metropolitanus]|uniref:regulator of nonsense transcripts 1 homolog n=1 Tax=Paramacrobiotus metropolitanus TaxID=2943436 RepID=UPI002445DF33|nr:regulator of nonsense transcripts 1 homolog [Paramacrobiotus metropolitanus]
MPVKTAPLPECAYCGLSKRQYLAYCNAENCQKWFCNGTQDNLGKSHIVAHCGKAKHTIISVSRQYVSTLYEPQCTQKLCTVRNIFELAVEDIGKPFNKRKTWCRKHAVEKDLVGRCRWNTLVAAHLEDDQPQTPAHTLTFFIRLSAWFLASVPQDIMDKNKAKSQRMWDECALDKDTVDTLEDFWRGNPRGTKKEFKEWKKMMKDFQINQYDAFADTNAYWRHWNRLVLQLSRQEMDTIKSLPTIENLTAKWIDNGCNADIEVLVPQGVLTHYLEKGQHVRVIFPIVQVEGSKMNRTATISGKKPADNGGDHITIHCIDPVDRAEDRVTERLEMQLLCNDVHYWRMLQALFKVRNDGMCMSPQILDAVLGRWTLLQAAPYHANSPDPAGLGTFYWQLASEQHITDVAEEVTDEETAEVEVQPLRIITTTNTLSVHHKPRPFRREYENSVAGFRDFCFDPESLAVAALNAKQKEAVQKALLNTVCLIQGPPGTGKTETAVAIIRSLALQDPQAKILVCAPSNVAIDDLTWKTARDNSSLKIFRLLPHGRDIACVDKRVEKYTVNWKFSQQHGSPNLHETEMWDVNEFERKCVKEAQVVYTTCNSAGLKSLERIRFPYVLIDEAAQAMEPDCLIAITRACEKLVLIGDPEQLGTVVSFPNLQKSQLGRSLFERLWGAERFPAGARVTLTQQYRMHPAISMMVSQITYEDQLVDDGCVLRRASASTVLDRIFKYSTQHRVNKKRAFLNANGFSRRVTGDIPMVFVDLAHNDELSGIGTSFVNMGEAHVIARLVANILHKDEADATMKPSPDNIGLITFYNGQRSQLRIDLQRHADAHSLPHVDIEINSVDGFQGREKDIIILSCVRSSETYMGRRTLGFTDDKRRLNVALSRAKKALIIVGNSEVFEHSELWQQYFQYIPREPLDMVCRFLRMLCSTLPRGGCQICPEGSNRRVQSAMRAFQVRQDLGR